MASLRSLLACVLCVASGCSFAISGPDPQRPRNEVPKCDTGKGAVGMDGLMASILGIAALAVIADGEVGGGVAVGAVGGLFLASAVRGNSAANECRAAYADYTLAYQQEQQQQLVREQPRPVAVKKKPPKPAAVPVVVEQTQPPVEQPPVEEPPAKPYATSRPVKQTEPPPKPKPQKRPDGEEDWSSFWKEATP